MSDSSKEEQRRVLVTGGAGFIGTHTCIVLLKQGYHVTVVDNFSNSSRLSIERVEQIVGNGKQIDFHELDIGDAAALTKMLAAQPRAFDACIHFAAFKAVGEWVDATLSFFCSCHYITTLFHHAHVQHLTNHNILDEQQQ
jgi:UDP-glucose 4-epimerase